MSPISSSSKNASVQTEAMAERSEKRASRNRIMRESDLTVDSSMVSASIRLMGCTTFSDRAMNKCYIVFFAGLCLAMTTDISRSNRVLRPLGLHSIRLDTD
jgi:hypothetical protein